MHNHGTITGASRDARRRLAARPVTFDDGPSAARLAAAFATYKLLEVLKP